MLAAYPRATIYHCDIWPKCTLLPAPAFHVIHLLEGISTGSGSGGCSSGGSGEVEPRGGPGPPPPNQHLLEAISTGCSARHELHMSCLYDWSLVIPGKGDTSTATATATLTTAAAVAACQAAPPTVEGVPDAMGETETETATAAVLEPLASAFWSFSRSATVSLPCGCELEYGGIWMIVMVLRAELWKEGSPSAATAPRAAGGGGEGGLFEAPAVGGGGGRRIENVLGDRPWGLQDAADVKLERARGIFAFPVKTR